MASVTRYLAQVLRLKVNPLKSRVCRIERLEYLGFTFQGMRIVWTERAFQDFKHRLRGLTSRRWRVSMADRIERLNQYLRGWMGYFGISKLYGPIPRIGQLVEATNPDVLLETMAQTENTHRQLAEAGYVATPCFLNGFKPEGILAVVTHDGDPYGNDEGVVISSRIALDP